MNVNSTHPRDVVIHGADCATYAKSFSMYDNIMSRLRENVLRKKKSNEMWC